MIGWTLAVPLFEAPEEPAHWQYARHLRDDWRLPVFGPGFVEANSPPLYYLAIAPLATRSEEPPPLMIESASGSLLMLAPPRLYQNSVEDLERYWPIRAARLVSVALSSATVWFCFLAGVAATGRRTTGLLAAGLVAFLPQFTFRGTNVSNDALVTMCAAAALYLLIVMAQRGFTWTRGLTIAAVIAAAFLSKVSAVFLPVPVGLAIITERGVPLVRRVRHLTVLLFGLVLVLPWVSRNYLLYGDPLAEAAMESAVAPIIVKKSLWASYFLDPFPSLLAQSFVGMFGWMNVPLPFPIYLLFGLIGVVALFGCGAALRGRTLSARLLLILATIPVLNLLLVVYINLTFTQPQGRYLFPALPALGVLAAVGLEGVLTWNRRRAALFVGALAALNVGILTFVVIPAYWPPPIARNSNARAVLGFRPAGADAASTFTGTIEAERYNFLEFEIEGPGQGHVLAGAVFFTPEGDVRNTPPPFVFVWQADGARHTVTIPLFLRPEWRGRIRELRIAGNRAQAGTVFRVDNVVVKGRLDPVSASAVSLRPRVPWGGAGSLVE